MKNLDVTTLNKTSILAMTRAEEFTLDGCELSNTDVDYELGNYNGIYIETTTPPLMMVTDIETNNSYLYECEKSYNELSKDDHAEILNYRGIDDYDNYCEVEDWFMSGLYLKLVGKVDDDGLVETRIGGIEVGENYYEVVQVGSRYLVAGTVCNAGLLEHYKMELDFDFTLDENLQEFISDIEEQETTSYPSDDLIIIR